MSAFVVRTTPRLDQRVLREIRREMELSHFKWDTQIGDTTTIAPFALVVSGSTWSELAHAAEQLTRETLAIEDELWFRRELHSRLAIPSALCNVLGAAHRRRVPYGSCGSTSTRRATAGVSPR